jgi:solute carrier family 25 (mitochondrial aspartate/glutamate transporter), member 12/13
MDVFVWAISSIVLLLLIKPLAQEDFLNYSARATRYGLFSPMEASIIFHFAGRGDAGKRLSLLDFAQLLDPLWQPPSEPVKPATVAKSFFENLAEASYNFGLGNALE